MKICMLLLQLKFNVHLPYIMEGSAGSVPTSQCLNQNTDWLTSLSVTCYIAGASLGVSCPY